MHSFYGVKVINTDEQGVIDEVIVKTFHSLICINQVLILN